MRQRRGFTLSEVLVATIVLGVIVGISLGGYTQQKRRSEHRAAVATLRSLGGAVRSYFYSFHTIPATGTTAATSATYGMRIQDDRFFGYTVTPAGGTFTMGVQYRSSPSGAGTAVYTFDSNGTQTGCSGSPCESM